MKIKSLTYLIASVVLTISYSNSAFAVDLADLEVMAKKNLWAELLEKAETVSASQRDSRWNELISKSLQNVLKSGSDQHSLSEVNALLQRYPFSSNDPELAKVIGTRLVNDLDNCISNYRYDLEHCSKQALSIINATKDISNAQVLEAANLVSRNNKALSLPLYACLFSKSDLTQAEQSLICAKSNLPQAVAEGFRVEKTAQLAKIASTATESSCRSEILPVLQESLSLNPPSSEYYKNVCPILIEAKLLKGIKKQRCLSNS